VKDKRHIAQTAIDELKIGSAIKNLAITHTESPWRERLIIEREEQHLNAEIVIWDDELFLPARIYRLFLFAADVLDPSFRYDPAITPDKHTESTIRTRHNHIWGLYVDSRIEKLGMESFYDRTLRKNLFFDLERKVSRKEAETAFDTLWEKASFSYPELVDHARNLDTLLRKSFDEGSPLIVKTVPDTDLTVRSVAEHIEQLTSQALQKRTHELLSCAAYNCKGVTVAPSYFGILFMYQRKVFIELVPLKSNTLSFTIFDASSDAYETHVIDESTDMLAIRKVIQLMYNKLAPPSEHI